jgi:hypothetical protein
MRRLWVLLLFPSVVFAQSYEPPIFEPPIFQPPIFESPYSQPVFIAPQVTGGTSVIAIQPQPIAPPPFANPWGVFGYSAVTTTYQQPNLIARSMGMRDAVTNQTVTSYVPNTAWGTPFLFPFAYGGLP